MAISNLGSRGKWVELASSSPTSGTVVTFSSLPEYSEYKITYFDVDTTSASARLDLTINNDTGSNYGFASLIDGSVLSAGVDAKIILGNGNGSVSGNFSGIVSIKDANQLVKEITYWFATTSVGQDMNNGEAIWNSQSVINRFDITLAVGTFTSGTFRVYGRN